MTEKYDELRDVYTDLIDKREGLKGVDNQTEFGDGRSQGLLDAIVEIEELLNEWDNEDET